MACWVNGTYEDCDDEDADADPGHEVGLVDAELKAGHPEDAHGDVVADEADDNPDPVPDSVLVHCLVVARVHDEVPITNSRLGLDVVRVSLCDSLSVLACSLHRFK
jgi:hypothetical protein